ncbi:HPr family phosphocarrier protein [Spiractinospora alimapuensis]|uniref:HPr family phosphocarrier protein n=1 Tax=Spiractinospora alimapuensis TaxID=2820884 RepID=UPI001F1C5305|nr:HPr family phosphocarrier protein [Spiractinospora alimapuensis]QVQ53964.1 HPr family phosphocarrier protein [Spiractinospora alimapuensis]
MASRTATIGSKAGLHARPAAVFAEAAAAQPVEVTIAKAESPEDSFEAGSILGLLGLGAQYGQKVVLTAEGDGAEAVLETLVTVLETEQDT